MTDIAWAALWGGVLVGMLLERFLRWAVHCSDTDSGGTKHGS